MEKLSVPGELSVCSDFRTYNHYKLLSWALGIERWEQELVKTMSKVTLIHTHLSVKRKSANPEKRCGYWVILRSRN